MINGKRIKELMEEKKITAKELAEVAEMSESFLNYVFSGNHDITVKTLVRIAGRLGVDVNQIVMDAEIEGVATRRKRIKKQIKESSDMMEFILDLYEATKENARRWMEWVALELHAKGIYNFSKDSVSDIEDWLYEEVLRKHWDMLENGDEADSRTDFCWEFDVWLRNLTFDLMEKDLNRYIKWNERTEERNNRLYEDHKRELALQAGEENG